MTSSTLIDPYQTTGTWLRNDSPLLRPGTSPLLLQLRPLGLLRLDFCLLLRDREGGCDMERYRDDNGDLCCRRLRLPCDLDRDLDDDLGGGEWASGGTPTASGCG
jgi:hypothetical protein